MKTLIYMFLILQFAGTVSVAQPVGKAQLNQEIASLKAEVYKAADVFLNSSNNIETRIKAIEKYPFIYDEAQIAKVKALILDEKQPALLRATALNKIIPEVPYDENLSNHVLKWLEDRNTPKVLREEALNTVKGLSFSSFATFKKRQELTAVLRTLSRDPDLPFRQFALSFLLDHGDSYAQSLLIEQLNGNRTDLLPTADMLRLLALQPKGDYLPTVFRIFQNPPDKESKVESMVLLGSYAPAKKAIVSLLKDKKQPEDVRTLALSIVNANYPAEFSEMVQNMIVDETEPEKLRVTAIVMETYRRKSNQERSKRKIPDQFDKNVNRLKKSPSANIRRATGAYLEEVKPKL